MKKFSQEKQTRFSLRKMTIGVCSVAIGLFFTSQHQHNTVEAATVQTTRPEAATQHANNSQASPTSNKAVSVNAATNTQPSQSTKQVADITKTEVTVASKQVVVNTTQVAINKDDKSSNSTSSQKLNKTTYKNQWVNENGSSYYYGNNGQKIVNQWHDFTSGTFYLGSNGHTVKNQWYTMPTKQTYYFDNDGHTVRNRWYTLPSKQTYYFDNDGHTVKNRWYDFSNGTYYVSNNGHTVKNQWYTMPTGNTYYFDKVGHTVKNRWYDFSNGTYYVGNDGHTVKNKWYTMPTGQTYYFDNNGHTVRNRDYKLNGTTYYFDNNGHTWNYGTPSEINGLIYYTFNAIGETIGSIEFNNSNIIEYAGHSHTLCKGNNVKYRRLGSEKYLVDYDETIEGQTTHRTKKFIISGNTWQFGDATFYKNGRTWFLLTRPEWADKSDFERAEKDKSGDDVSYY